ncbi:MAG: hypothetical protein KDK66_00460 [Deltaproteobacteria bacterium]|nr:hypothetical protein [Deltaproteobacteria bacterium]
MRSPFNIKFVLLLYSLLLMTSINTVHGHEKSIMSINFEVAEEYFKLKNKKLYTSLEEALKNPNDVYKLSLAHQKQTKLSKRIKELTQL